LVSKNTSNPYSPHMCLLGIVRKIRTDRHAAVNASLVNDIVGKDFYRDDGVNSGHYSKKREGVADVDPKVSILKHA
jgi:hypothetical protein